MKIEGPGIYHIYNRGNFKQPIFYTEEHYYYFLEKCHKYLKPVSNVLSWCLMPNHFHFLIELTEQSLSKVQSGGILMPAITNGFRLLQSSYSKGLNKQLGRTGNLFQQKTKAKNLENNFDYLINAFIYIHKNPLEAGIVADIHDWPHSSFDEFTCSKSSTLTNIERARELLRLDDFDWNLALMRGIDIEILKKIV